MKRILFSLLWCIPLCLFGGTYLPYSSDATQSQFPQRTETTVGNSVIIEYNFPGCDISFVEEGEDSYAIPRINGFGMSGEVGGPALPFYQDYLLVPDTSATVQVLSSSYQEFSNYLVYPEQLLQFESDTTTAVFYKDSTLYAQNSFTPQEIVKRQGVQIYKKMPLLQVAVRPIQYNPVTRKMRCYTNIRYKVTYATTSSTGLVTDSTSYKFLKRAISNPSLLNTVNVEHQSDRILVVTVDKYLSPVRSYMRWKKSVGFDYEILSKASWISSQEVKDSINAIHNRQPIDYLFIVGGHQDVPAEYRIINYYQDRNSAESFYTDLFYACMDEESNDPHFSMDHMADMGRGRIPVNTVGEAQLVLNRIKQYQTSPSQNESDYKGIVSGYFESTDGERESRRFILTCEEIRNYLINKNISIDRVYYTESYINPLYYNNKEYAGNERVFPESLKRTNYAWDGNAEDIINGVNSNCSFILYRGHGTDSTWCAPLFHKNDFTLLHNTVSPIVFSICCQTGIFNKDSCFAEMFLKNRSGGASGVIAATEKSYSGWNDAFTIGMFNTIWNDPGIKSGFGAGSQDPTSGASHAIYRMGDVLNHGLLEMSKTWDKENVNGVPLTNALFHYFGDPTTEIWAKCPISITGVQVIQDSSTITISCDTIGYNIIVMSKQDQGESYFQVAENCETTTFTHIRVPCTITVTKPNHIPYVFNEDVEVSGKTYSEKCAVVGKDITIFNTTVDYEGDVTIDATGDVNISDTFDVKGLFEIK